MDYSVNQGNRVPLLRIIDANANRATEGMRVIEEYARFALDDAHLTRLQKQLRHDLIEVLQVLPREELCAARTTEQDVGTQIATQAEFERQDIRQVATANQKRVEQSLRSLEEFLKPLSAETARQIEQLRYRAYALGRAVELTGFSRQRLEQAKLYVLVDGGESLDAFSTAAAALVRSGVHVLQLRDLRLDDRQLVARGRRLRELTRETPTLFVMNNRPDLAVLTQADGVHVGQDDLSLKEVRAIAGPNVLVGVSTHSVAQARQAVIDGANYLGCGPTFPSRTKSFAEFPGLEFLQAVSSEISLPAFAIGGISPANLPEVQASGFSRVAVASAVTEAEDPELTARQFMEALNRQETVQCSVKTKN
ncbi:MAG: thiamine phosphate synthase [Pirellulaceae bacterium]|nr:thiamine phosphate synthase [Pirellulaceae bacterium]